MPEKTSTVVLRGRVLLPEAMIDDGVVVARGDRLAFVGTAVEARDAGFDAQLGEVPPSYDYLLPGLVDLHNHGGGGVGFPDAASPGEALRAVLEHRRHGTTTMLASLVTADPHTLAAQAAMLADLADAGEIAGIHAEGPFLSHERRGAHNPAYLRDGDAAVVRDLAKAARGHLATMTVAPEVPGVAGPGGAATALIEAGAIPSLGHTDGTTEAAEALISQVTAGLRLAAEVAGVGHREMTATHLFNGMRPLHHRAPGPVAACFAAAARGDLVVELIADGVHLDPATVRTVFGTVGADQVALVTDAMSAAGMADGSYDLGPMSVTVRDGVARLVDPGDPDAGAIAGGTAHLIDVVRHTVAAGVPLLDAVRSASAVPARVLGLGRELGTLARGLRADVLVADEDLRPRRVLRGGAEIPG
ncbi:N-acetylglucosamine-6-phosphate deacetylase [Myceligenerans pegani]|uniref:Amidohydrolase family protein n=1 Tax=Myceligenerans pegani TaxID=2776917 RepID=A0ABR9MU07_9MICO|nr:amidohydrolase family protein [Myceligenerans sp. TRM 65318]MBE1874859.1 amidohydrolase family protein [Myceligenerans sp. TRM 65318]MBE3017130.1 amidohydrolase family protein [Myceligenerans sp. TRM 65318]